MINEEDATEATQDSDTSSEVSETPVAPVQTEAADSSEDAPSDSWNGELESLQTSDWVRSLDDDVRSNLLGGIETKYKHWQRGYTDKFQETAAWRKQLETREEELRANEAKVQKWLYDTTGCCSRSSEERPRSSPRAKSKCLPRGLRQAHRREKRRAQTPSRHRARATR